MLRRLLQAFAEPMPDPIRPPTEIPERITQKVSLIIHNPHIPMMDGRKLGDVFGWNDPVALAQAYAQDLHEVSHGYITYDIVEVIEVDGFPTKIDGFTYGADAYYTMWRDRTRPHDPDWADYNRILQAFQIIPKINHGIIDEVWLHAFPQAGYYESRMVGPGAFWCNAPGIDTPEAHRRFVVMGFNFERGVGEMLESFGHRVESIMAHTYRHHRGDANMWSRYIQYDKTHPGRAQVGNVHFAPNSDRDYDWGNKRPVPSAADDWWHYPFLTGEQRIMDCRDWGNGDIRLHHRWWLERIPHVAGVQDGIVNNWWTYIINPNLCP